VDWLQLPFSPNESCPGARRDKLERLQAADSVGPVKVRAGVAAAGCPEELPTLREIADAAVVVESPRNCVQGRIDVVASCPRCWLPDRR
jgi:hypothetical protein